MITGPGLGVFQVPAPANMVQRQTITSVLVSNPSIRAHFAMIVYSFYSTLRYYYIFREKDYAIHLFILCDYQSFVFHSRHSVMGASLVQ